ncbi:hypothetical protein ZEAMMB73_Zm00001d016444 [Zea mays]|uniref:Uncharacterized protein n=1 Tax=Zea mays TaxID=4577 RepID=A0A1D6H7P5_MAIZE|nr:hypothetical protein ZEAMMB73_Zm00001d016444 [Zea mays]
MATARKDPQQVDKVNLKPSESGKGVVRRARSVPTSPDRRSSPSPAPVSDNASRPASSLNTRTTSSRSTTTSSSAASSSHGKTMRSASSSVGGASASARQQLSQTKPLVRTSSMRLLSSVKRRLNRRRLRMKPR